jgi:hypothetical protein
LARLVAGLVFASVVTDIDLYPPELARW